MARRTRARGKLAINLTLLTCFSLLSLALCLLLQLQQATSGEAKSVYLLANLDDARLLPRTASYKWLVKRDNEPATPETTSEVTSANQEPPRSIDPLPGDQQQQPADSTSSTDVGADDAGQLNVANQEVEAAVDSSAPVIEAPAAGNADQQQIPDPSAELASQIVTPSAAVEVETQQQAQQQESQEQQQVPEETEQEVPQEAPQEEPQEAPQQPEQASDDESGGSDSSSESYGQELEPGTEGEQPESGAREVGDVKAVTLAEPAKAISDNNASSNASTAQQVEQAATQTAQVKPSESTPKLELPSGPLKDIGDIGDAISNLTSAVQLPTVEGLKQQLGVSAVQQQPQQEQQQQQQQLQPPQPLEPIKPLQPPQPLLQQQQPQQSLSPSSESAQAKPETQTSTQTNDSKKSSGDPETKLASPSAEKSEADPHEPSLEKPGPLSKPGDGPTVASAVNPQVNPAQEEASKLLTNEPAGKLPLANQQQQQQQQQQESRPEQQSPSGVALVDSTAALAGAALTDEQVASANAIPKPPVPEPKLEGAEISQPEAKGVKQENAGLQVELTTKANETETAKPSLEPLLEESPEEATGFSYKVDMSSCSATRLDEQTFNKMIETILSTLTDQNCSDVSSAHLKLKPLVNKHLANYVLESSSLALDPTLFTYAQMTHASCLANESAGNASSTPSSSFKLKLEQEFADQYLSSQWRLYPKLQQDDLPEEVFKSLAALKSHNHAHYDQSGHRHQSGRSGNAGNHRGAGDRCQRFNVESGDFYLELLALRTSLVLEVELDESNGGCVRNVRLLDLRANQLYLDNGLMCLKDSEDARDANSGSSSLHWRHHSRQQTRQVLHANNNHFRRNNWLLDLFGNWMKHEYRQQLRHLFNGGQLRAQLDSCLSNVSHNEEDNSERESSSAKQQQQQQK